MTESNIGKGSMFLDILRTGLGNGLFVTSGHIHEYQVYQYKTERLTKKEYCERIDKYFYLINQYPGHIGIDISGSYDTRLVLSIAHKNIKSFTGFSNNNQFDGGIDAELSPIIAHV